MGYFDALYLSTLDTKILGEYNNHPFLLFCLLQYNQPEYPYN